MLQTLANTKVDVLYSVCGIRTREHNQKDTETREKERKRVYLPMRYVLCLFTCTCVYDVNLNPNEMPINFISIDFLLLSISGAKWKTVLHSIDNEKKNKREKKYTKIKAKTH